MNKRIYFKDTQVAPEMEEYANEQLKRIEQFLEHEQSPISINLTIVPSKVHAHSKVELQITSPHYHLFCEHEKKGDDVYEALDKVIDTMYLRLHEEKERRVDELKKGDPKGSIKD